jgi:hypothetical protein
MIVSPQPSCHNRLKSLNSFSVSLLAMTMVEPDGSAALIARVDLGAAD